MRPGRASCRSGCAGAELSRRSLARASSLSCCRGSQTETVRQASAPFAVVSAERRNAAGARGRRHRSGLVTGRHQPRGAPARGREERLEFPLGTLLYEPPPALRDARPRPTGQEVAFFERDAAGLHRRSSSWIARRPAGPFGPLVRLVEPRLVSRRREVWFGGARAGSAASLYAVDRGGQSRALLTAPGTLELQRRGARSQRARGEGRRPQFRPGPAGGRLVGTRPLLARIVDGGGPFDRREHLAPPGRL